MRTEKRLNNAGGCSISKRYLPKDRDGSDPVVNVIIDFKEAACLLVALQDAVYQLNRLNANKHRQRQVKLQITSNGIGIYTDWDGREPSDINE